MKAQSRHYQSIYKYKCFANGWSSGDLERKINNTWTTFSRREGSSIWFVRSTKVVDVGGEQHFELFFFFFFSSHPSLR